VQGILRLLYQLPWIEKYGYFETKRSWSQTQHAVMKAALIDEHKPYHLAFAESSLHRQWDGVILSDESTFSSANDGLVLVYRPWGECYNSQYMSTSTRIGCVSVHRWDWISHKGVGILHHIEDDLDGLQYKHILKHVMVPSVRVLNPDGVIQFHQDLFSFHDSRVVQEWLSRQADVELIDWPPRTTDMNPI
jgi:hypothetical protein